MISKSLFQVDKTYAVVFPRTIRSDTSPAMNLSRPGPLSSSCLNFDRAAGVEEVEGVAAVARPRMQRGARLWKAHTAADIFPGVS